MAGGAGNMGRQKGAQDATTGQGMGALKLPGYPGASEAVRDSCRVKKPTLRIQDWAAMDAGVTPSGSAHRVRQQT